MKKYLTIVILFALVVGLSGCGQGDSNEPASNPVANISNDLSVSADIGQVSDGLATGVGAITFKYLYRGFTSVRLENTEMFAAFNEVTGDRLILTEDDWQDYMGKYCPSIYYFEDVDFTSQCLIAVSSMGSKSTFAVSSDIKSITSGDDTLLVESDNDPDICIYALNTDDVTHFYIAVIIINRGNLPKSIADNWIYSK